MTVGRSMATHYAKYPVGVERLPTIGMSRRDADEGPSVLRRKGVGQGDIINLENYCNI